MLKLIHAKFQDRTLIAVLHQLQAVLDFDFVVVIADGQIAEFGKPTDLLNSRSAFRELWDAGNLGDV